MELDTTDWPQQAREAYKDLIEQRKQFHKQFPKAPTETWPFLAALFERRNDTTGPNDRRRVITVTQRKVDALLQAAEVYELLAEVVDDSLVYTFAVQGFGNSIHRCRLVWLFHGPNFWKYFECDCGDWAKITEEKVGHALCSHLEVGVFVLAASIDKNWAYRLQGEHGAIRMTPQEVVEPSWHTQLPAGWFEKRKVPNSLKKVAPKRPKSPHPEPAKSPPPPEAPKSPPRPLPPKSPPPESTKSPPREVSKSRPDPSEARTNTIPAVSVQPLPEVNVRKERHRERKALAKIQSQSVKIVAGVNGRVPRHRRLSQLYRDSAYDFTKSKKKKKKTDAREETRS